MDALCIICKSADIYPPHTQKDNPLADKLPFCGKIAARVKKLEADGLARTRIFDAIQNYQNAPKSMKTFYKLYRTTMDEVHADTASEIGGMVVKQAKEGDFKSQEFYLRSKGGWSPQSTQEVLVDDTEVSTTALDKIKSMLGKK